MKPAPKLPRSVTIGGKRLQIRICAEIEDWGQYDHDRKVITISERAARGREAIPTLRHEMMHAALEIGGVAFSTNFEEESIVRCMDDIFWPAWERIEKRF